MMFPISGGSATQLAASPVGGSVTGLAANAERVVWTEGCSLVSLPVNSVTSKMYAYPNGCPLGPMAVDDINIYWIDRASLDVLATPLAGDGTDTRILVKGASATDGLVMAPTALATDGTNVYWADSGNFLVAKSGFVAEAPVNGGSTATVLAADQDDPTGITAANGTIYWTNRGDSGATGAVLSLEPSTSASPTIVADNQIGAIEVQVSGTSLFWIAGALPDRACAYGESPATTGCAALSLRGMRLGDATVTDIVRVDNITPATNLLFTTTNGSAYWLTSASINRASPDGKITRMQL